MTTMTTTTIPPSLFLKTYSKLKNYISKFKKAVDRSPTLTEKILIGHLDEKMMAYSHTDNELLFLPGKSYVFLKPDRVASQDIIWQMTILQFMQAGIERTRVPTTVHCDHLIKARIGSDPDTKAALY